MAESEAPITSDSPAQVTAPVKTKKSKSANAIKKPKSKPNHPPTSEMVQNSISSLKERGGSSLQAIKKYISATYKIDAEKLSPFIKKYLKAAVISGQLVQTKGKGASGSFKLPAKQKDIKTTTKKTTSDKPKPSKKASNEKKPKSVAKKVAASAKKEKPKKPIVEKKKVTGSAKRTSIKAAPKVKTTKPVKITKAPKPKKVVTPKKAMASPKKAKK